MDRNWNRDDFNSSDARGGGGGCLKSTYVLVVNIDAKITITLICSFCHLSCS